MSVQSPKYDFFISRAGQDSSAARLVGEILERNGHSVFVQDWDFGPGADFTERMDFAIRHCNTTITLLSEEYLLSPYCGLEWRAIISNDPSNRNERLKLFRIKECYPSGLLSLFAWIDLIDPLQSNDRDLLERLVLVSLFPDRAGPGDAELLARYRQSAATVSVIDPRLRSVPYFSGREDHMEKIRSHFKDSDGQGTRCVVLHGLGGVGKTSIAKEYSAKATSNYFGIWLVNAESNQRIIASLIDLAKQINSELVIADDPVRSARAALSGIVEQSPSRWLIVFDNIESESDFSAWMPRTNADLIVTTRLANPNIDSEHINVDGWERGTSIEFLSRTMRRDDISGEDLFEISARLADLPLALTQTASLFRMTRDLTVNSWLRNTDHHLSNCPFGDEYGKAVYATVWSAITELGSNDPTGGVNENDCLKLLQFASFLSPDNIPVDLYEDNSALYPETLNKLVGVNSNSERARSQALNLLHQYSIIDYVPANGFFSAHRLVLDVCLNSIGEDRFSFEKSVLASISRRFDDPEFENWSTLSLLSEHAFVCASRASNSHGENLAYLLNRVGKFLQENADFDRTHICYEKAEGILSESNPTDLVSLATLKNNIGTLSLLKGNRNDAESNFHEAIRLIPGTHGAERATYLHNLGNVLRQRNEYDEAKRLLEEALRIDEAMQPQSPVSLSRDKNSLGVLFREIGDLKSAEDFYIAALTHQREATDQANPLVATRLQNIAELQVLRGDYLSADVKFREAIEIIEDSLGDIHPRLTLPLSNLGKSKIQQSLYSEAEEITLRALSITESALGTNHPEVIRDLNQLSLINLYVGKVKIAEQYLMRANSVIEQNHLGQSAEASAVLTNFAVVQTRKGELEKAEETLRHALSIGELVHGKQHFETAQTLSQLANLLSKMSRFQEARVESEKAAKLFESSLGADSERYAMELNNLALILEQCEEPNEAKNCLELSIKILENRLGVTDPKTMLAKSNLQGLQLGRSVVANKESIGKSFSEDMMSATEKFAASLLSGDTKNSEDQLGKLIEVTFSHLEDEPDEFKNALKTLTELFGQIEPDPDD